jgi:small subunit ribosomal protein S9
MAEEYKYALGRRKTASATVRIYKGAGQNMVNGKLATDLYTQPSQQKRLNLPFVATKTDKDYYFTAVTTGGGISGQIDAIVLGLARALDKEDPEYHTLLKQNGLLSRDPRMVERKKTGLRKARKAPQFSKR